MVTGPTALQGSPPMPFIPGAPMVQIYRLTLPLCYLSQWEIYIQEVILIHMVWWHISTTLFQDYVINLVNLLQLTLQHHLLPLEE